MRASFVRGVCRCLLCAAALLFTVAGGTAGAAPAVEVPASDWSSFTLQASRFGSTATAVVERQMLPTAAAIPAFIESPRGLPLEATRAELQKLSVSVTLEILGGRRVRIENHLWFDPYANTPLYLLRTRFGLDDYHQQFRFTREGVFRYQREPATAGETAKPPDAWTRIKQHFYPYPLGPSGCPPILETSQMIPLAEVILMDLAAAARPLCVFHKRQVHRVSVYPLPARMVSFDYLERRADGEIQRVGTVSARGARIVSRPIESYRGDVEELFRDGSQLWFNPEGRLPLAVSGELPVIGRVEMRLKEMRLKTSKE